jgi:hypothetical protein
MSLLFRLAARPAPPVSGPSTSDLELQPSMMSYQALRRRIRATERRMATTSSSTTAGGIDYDTDDNDHKPRP